MNKYHKIIGALVVLLLISLVAMRGLHRRWQSKENVLQGEIVRSQEVVKEKDGVYTRMVNRYDQTRDSLRDKLKEKDEDLAKTLRKNREKILMYEEIVATFKPKTDTVLLVDTIIGDYTKSFAFYYPQKPDWFIKLAGGIRNDSVFGSWRFGNLPLSLTLSENKDGTWTRRLIGPEWIKVSKIEVNSLLRPPEAIKKKLYFPVGAGYTFFAETRMLNLYGGISWRRFTVLGSAHFQDQLGPGIGINAFFRF